MSELQLAIAALGALGIAAVVAYNAWVSRRHRKLGDRMLPRIEGDPLLDEGAKAAPQGQEKPTPAARPAARVEPVIDATPAGPTADEGPEPHLLSADFDFVLSLTTLDPVSGERLASLAGELGRANQRRVAVLGLDEGSRQWQVVDGTGACLSMLVGLQLTDRRGAADEAEIALFSGAVRRFADEVMAVVDAPPLQQAAEQARQLDALCARVDTQVGINVVGRNMAFSAARLRTLIERNTADFAEDGSALVTDAEGNTLFVIFDHDGQSLAPAAIAGSTIRGLTFLLDVPRVGDGARVFARMVQVARDFAGTLGGELVDDQRLPLTDAALDPIARQIAQQQDLMAASGIAPGSRLARRLFV